MSLYRNKQGFYNKEYEELWQRLVPESGEADTIQGELLRCKGAIGYEYYHNGNDNWRFYHQQCLNFLQAHLRDHHTFAYTVIQQITDDLERINYLGNDMRDGNPGNFHCVAPVDYNFYEEGEDAHDRILDRIVEWCYANPQLKPLKTGAEAPTMASVSDVFEETPQRYQPPGKRSVASVDWQHEQERFFKLVALGGYEADYRLTNGYSICSNARSRNDFYDAYAAGVEITGIDIQSRCQVSNGYLTDQEYEKLKPWAIALDRDDLVWNDEEPLAYDIHRSWIYIDVWATIAHIGNPDLIIKEAWNPTRPYLYIGGDGLFHPDEKITYDSDYSIMFRNWRAPSPTLPGCTRYEIIIGGGESCRSYRPEIRLHVLSNVSSCNVIKAAYKKGAEVVDVDLESLCDGYDTGTLTVADLKKIIAKAQPEDLDRNNPALPYFTDGYEPDDADHRIIRVSRTGYFVFWRAITRIGNPALILHLLDDNTETIDIGGYGSFDPDYKIE